MNEQTEKFLDGIGITTDIIANLKDPSDDLDVKTLSDDYNEKKKSVFSNDPDVIKELALKAKGKERGSVERKIKKVFNITPEEWGDNELEGDYEKALIFGFDKQKKSGSSSAQELQDELQDANKKIEWYKSEEIPRIQKTEKLKVDNFHIGRYLRELIVDSGELASNIGGDVAEIVLKEELRKKGLTASLEEGKLAILTADGLVPQDEEKTRNLSNMELVKGIMTGKGLLKQSNAGIEPPKPTPRARFTETPPSTEGLPHLAAAEKNLKNLQGMEKDKGRGFGNLK